MQAGWERSYYTKQAEEGFTPYVLRGYRYQTGRGFSPYAGNRYQRGNGFLGRIWKGIALPLLKYVGKNGLEAAGNIVSEVRNNPDDVAKIVRTEAKKMAGKAIEDGGKRLSEYVQTGKGVTHKGPLLTYVKPRCNNKRADVMKKTNKRVTAKGKAKHKSFLSSKCRNT